MRPLHTLPRAARPGAGRASALVAGALACILLAACSTDNVGGPRNDEAKPVVRLTGAADAGSDTSVAFAVNVTDNLGIKMVAVQVTGAASAEFADTIRTAQTTFARTYAVPVAARVGAPLQVIARAMDGAGNLSDADTLNLAVGNVTPADVRVTSPAGGTGIVAGKSVIVSISARSAVKVRTVGFEVKGAFALVDSTRFTSPLRDSLALVDTLTVPAGVSGAATLTPFMFDSVGQRVAGTSISLTVGATASSSSAPVVALGITRRIEATDTVHVEATDPTGISALGYEVRDSTGRIVLADSIVDAQAQFTSRPKTFKLQLNLAQFPARRFVQGFARNGAGNRAYVGGSTARVDTVDVVAGLTYALPSGGRVADVYYHPTKDRLYLSNIERNQIEVFNVADSSFKRGIDVGSRPWGLAPWPRNHDGTPGDTLLVANSGGTSISYVNLNGGGDAIGREAYRYGLPNIIVYKVTTARNPTTGVLFQERTVFDFSDRPQFIGATCTGASNTPCGDVSLVYSTVPTAGQSVPFPNKGTIRWENLTRQTSHFFFEQAMGSAVGSRDTLMVERFRAKDGNGVFLGADSVLVPYIQNTTNPAGLYSIEVDVNLLGFRDTTFVRNSGDFRRAVFGEGGNVINSRALEFDANAGLAPTTPQGATLTLPVIDRGVSRTMDVSDFIANTSSTVLGVAMNFDGELAAVRGNSSTALIGTTLRLQGLAMTSPSNAGFDFHPRNTGTFGSTTTRLAFAAAAEPQIEVYDTYCYQRVAIIPVRDPIIGPIKSARRTNGQIVLVGATARGVVIANLADSFTSSCQQ